MNKLLLIFCIVLNFAVDAAPTSTSKNIVINQFGYLPAAKKIAVIRDPQTGYDAAGSFAPGSTYQLRDWNTDAIIYSASPTVWNNGLEDASSGDKAWWFDFSSVTTPGDYYVYDPTNNVGSYKFQINDCVYNEVLKHVVRSYYYQRSGFPKRKEYAGLGWADSAAFVGSLQDKNCRIYSDRTNAATEKDLSGGWFDAGDYNKYVNFTWETLIDLLLAYEENPTIWADNYNIPESGNGIPDLLDEVKWELDWLLKMQQSDGSVLSVIGVGITTNSTNGFNVNTVSPPSANTGQSLYGPATTSASLTCAGVFALAAKVYKSLGVPSMASYSATLETAAVNAWTWADANQNVQFLNNVQSSNSIGLAAGQNEPDSYGRTGRKIAAACFLYALTGNATYKTYFESNYTSFNTYVYPFESLQQDIQLYYTKLSGITSSVKTNIFGNYVNGVKYDGDQLPAYTGQTKDAYMAHLKDYVWGSNSTKARQGDLFYNMITYNQDAANATKYYDAAATYVHYILGVNPLSKVYLSNMNSYGAENSVTEFYHSWFKDGSAKWDKVGVSIYGPAPGYMPGGPNPGYDIDACCNGSTTAVCGGSSCGAILTTPPKGQPKQKSYKDFNNGWPIDSWAVTENGIYYQASFVKLLSKFASSGTCSVTTGISTSMPSAIQEVAVFPNPSSGDLNISSVRTIKEITLLDMSGKEVSSYKNINETNFQIKTQLTGLYILKISTDVNTVFEKVVLE